MRLYFVYMVLCDDGSYYIGVTNDVERRVAQHNAGEDDWSYTYTRRPVACVYTAEFRDPDAAIRWEKQIKKWSRAKKAALARGDYDALKRLSKSGLGKLGRGSTSSPWHELTTI